MMGGDWMWLAPYSIALIGMGVLLLALLYRRDKKATSQTPASSSEE